MTDNPANNPAEVAGKANRKKLTWYAVNYLADLWPWSRLNWRNFCLIEITGEVNECYAEFRFVVIGLGFGIEWWRNWLGVSND